jgi:hypothetical protein
MLLILDNIDQLAIMISLRVHPVYDCTNSEGWKLTTSFLKKFKILEHQFRNLIPINVVKDEFEDFLMEKYDIVRDMNEIQFVDLVINEKADEYRNFVR